MAQLASASGCYSKVTALFTGRFTVRFCAGSHNVFIFTFFLLTILHEGPIMRCKSSSASRQRITRSKPHGVCCVFATCHHRVTCLTIHSFCIHHTFKYSERVVTRSWHTSPGERLFCPSSKCFASPGRLDLFIASNRCHGGRRCV